MFKWSLVYKYIYCFFFLPSVHSSKTKTPPKKNLPSKSRCVVFPLNTKKTHKQKKLSGKKDELRPYFDFHPPFFRLLLFTLKCLSALFTWVQGENDISWFYNKYAEKKTVSQKLCVKKCVRKKLVCIVLQECVYNV